MEKINDHAIFIDRLEALKAHFNDVTDDVHFHWKDVCAILSLKMRKNWTTESKNSNIQLNSNDLNDFFPIIQISEAFPHWRISIDAALPLSVLNHFVDDQRLYSMDWVDGHISYRHKIQNGYPYLQLTLEDNLSILKRSLKENDQIFFLKSLNQPLYFIFASKEKIFNEDSILIIDEPKTKLDKTQYRINETQYESISSLNKHYYAQIFYGAPGSGKSYKIDNITEKCKKTTITFHPDTDYTSFIGLYKPTMTQNKIEYKFIAQCFTKIYVEAWQNPDVPHFLIIEELNRGNCAQIFGDMFQLLDRHIDGYSEYTIDIDNDMAEHLESKLSGFPLYKKIMSALSKVTEDEFRYTKIALPNNLFILATMNTSDQSLFPMDNAFKRRWNWKYVPIDYIDAGQFTIEIGENRYNWRQFLENVNPKIQDLTGSEDKQLGNRFVNPHNKIISFEQFRSKILFYLWHEIYKDESKTAETIFKISQEEEITFSKLFSKSIDDDMSNIIKILDYNELRPMQTDLQDEL